MYENDKITINWLKIIVRVVIAFLILMLTIKLVSICLDNSKNSKNDKILENNLNILDEFANTYFTDDLLPDEVGKSVKISVQDLIDEELLDIEELDNADSCDMEGSYIQATRLEDEYQLKSFMVCGDEEDTKNSFIEDKNTELTTEVTTTTTRTTVTTTTTSSTTSNTTKKTTTTTKKTKNYQISFNSNGGSSISSVTVKAGAKLSKPENPVRAGYEFVGWYYRGEAFDFDKAINQDYVLVAKWIKK